MTFIYDDKIRFDDSSDLTAFGRLRTADARLLGEYRYMYGSGTSTEMNDHIVGGGTLTADQPRNCFLARVGTANNDTVIRQTKQYHPYIPGTSNIGMITFTLNAAKNNLSQSVGLFDDLNGIIFRMNGTTAEVVIRKNGIDDQVISQQNWSLDRLDGSMNEYNKSGFLADWTKCQILIIDYQWLGVGKVRVGFVTNSEITYVHQFEHVNVVTEVYMNQPSLPCRWEIKNTGTTSSNSELMLICGAVYCEGAEYETGFMRSVSTDGTTVTLAADSSANGKGILAIRLKNTLVNNKPNRAMTRLKNFSIVVDNDTQYKIVILPNDTYLANNSNTAWTSVPGYGWCEYVKNFNMATNWSANNDYWVISDGFATGSAGNKAGSVETNLVDNKTSSIFQNYHSNNSQIFAIIGYRLGTDVNSRASLSWLEVK